MLRVFGRVLAVLWLVGCQGAEPFQRAAVEGKVTYDGAPLAAGTIRFVPRPKTDGPTVFAPIVDGEFHLSTEAGPALGRYTVEITATRRAVPKHAGPHGRPVEAEEQFIPARYNVDSTLEAEIQPATNTLTFDLHGGASK